MNTNILQCNPNSSAVELSTITPTESEEDVSLLRKSVDDCDGLLSEKLYFLTHDAFDPIADLRESWVCSAFSPKRCSHVVVSEENSRLCGCGRKVDEHTWTKQKGVPPWCSKKHTHKLPIVYNGCVTFVTENNDQTDGSEQISKDDFYDYTDGLMSKNNQKYRRLSKYLVVPDGVEKDNMLDLKNYIEKKWKLDKPLEIVISVYGNKTYMSSELKRWVHADLIEVFQTLNTWIFTDGASHGLADFIGYTPSPSSDLASPYNFIGFSTFDKIYDEWKLKAIHHTEDLDLEEIKDNIDRIEVPGDSFFASNHPYYIIVNDGSITKNNGKDHLVRNALLKTLAKAEYCSKVLMLVFGGKFEVFEHILNNLEKETNLSVIVVKGTGMLADALIHWLNQDSTGVESFLTSLNNYLVRVSVNDTEFLKNVEEDNWIMLKEKIVIFDVNGKNQTLQKSVIQSIAKDIGTNGSLMRQNKYVKTVLHWELINDHTMTMLRNIAGKSEKYKRNILFTWVVDFMLEGKVASVKALFEVIALIDGWRIKLNSHISELYERSFKNSEIMKFLAKENNGEKIYHLIDQLLEEDFSLADFKEDDLIIQLTIWSVLSNQPKLTRCLFNICNSTPMVLAIVVCRLYTSLLEMSFKDELKKIFDKERKHFGDIATRLLSIYQKTNPKYAKETALYQHSSWHNKSALEMCYQMEFKAYFTNSCVQQITLSKWKGTMPSERYEFHKEVQFAQEEKGESKFQVIKPERVVVSPQIKFYLELVIYFIFLCSYSYFTHLYVYLGEVKSVEKCLSIIVVAYLLDAVRQLTLIKKKSKLAKLKVYFDSGWSWIDMSAYILYFVVFGLRLSDDLINKQRHMLSIRILHAFGVVLWYCKFFKFYRVNKSLGSYVETIYRMLQSLVTFLAVLFIAVIGYGYFMHSLLHHPGQDHDHMMLFEIIFIPYKTMFGDPGVQESDDKNITLWGSPTLPGGDTLESVALIGTIFYMFFSNVLLLNVVIAMFNNIYSDVIANSDCIWKYEYYKMVTELEDQYITPFSILANIYSVIKSLARKLKIIGIPETPYVCHAMQSALFDFERGCMKKFLIEQPKYKS